MKTVEIKTGARLHFGPLSVHAPAGGRFGGVGVMIDSPGVVLSARLAAVDRVDADSTTSPRISEFLSRIRQSVPAFGGCEIEVRQMIPSHRGFGSGTQLGLAVALAASILMNEAEPAMETLARRAGRGLRSAIGLHGFRRGGFLVDGGRATANQIGTLVSRVAFPDEWRFVLATPRQTMGLCGEAEQSAFARQPSMPQSLTSELCRIVLMDWLPAVMESDFNRCAESLYQYGRRVGEFFAPAQGGVFANGRMSELAGLLLRRGIAGVAQTSWGPTLALLCSSDTQARQIQQDFVNDADWADCAFDIVSPMNHGAVIRTRSCGARDQPGSDSAECSDCG